MTQEQMTQYVRIYNTLMDINTKGNDTLIMADCLRALKALGESIKIVEEKVAEEE